MIIMSVLVAITLDGKKMEDGVVVTLANGRNVPNKVVHYFPLIPRLQRLFTSSKTARFMRWHVDERAQDGYLRHPCDSLA